MEASFYVVGVDIGGTFTDCAVLSADGDIVIGKAPTTPEDLTCGFRDAVADAARKLGLSAEDLLSRSERLVHGTTQGTNAIVTRSGARAGLILTRGHGEALKIMAGGGRTAGLPLERILDIPFTNKPAPIVPPALVREVVERIDSEGRVIVPLDMADARRAVQSLIDEGVEAIGVCLLWSFLSPQHELMIKQLIEEMAPKIHVSVSCELAPTIGEYPRCATVAMNAYTGPILTRYIKRLQEYAEAARLKRLLFTTCAGGTITAKTAQALPIQTLQSGPAAGIAGSALFGKEMGYPNIVTADMGGTTFDVGLIVDGEPTLQRGVTFEQYELHLPMVDVQSVGAGGGSIGWIDTISRTLRVGPHSAGARPGPVCYGEGGMAPTVTDADLVMGFLDPNNFLGGQKRLDVRVAELAIAALGEKIGLGVDETAAGISMIVDSRMADLIRRVTLFKGYDPRDFVLFAFGGGSPLHAGLFAAELGIEAVVVPLAGAASVWSALGAASADLSHLSQRSRNFAEPFDSSVIEGIFAELEAEADAHLAEDGMPRESRELRRLVRMKFPEQVFELEIPLPSEAFDESAANRLPGQFIVAYEQRYGKGTAYASAGVIITGFEVRAFGRVRKPRINRFNGVIKMRSQAPASRRSVYWLEERRRIETPIFDGERLDDGAFIEGPAIVEFPVTTLAIRPGQTARLDAFGNVVLAIPQKKER